MFDNFTKIYQPVLTGRENLNASEIQVCCPFHNDKNPSMSINTNSGLFHCFGCGVSGSAIGFVMRYHNIGYSDALKFTGENNNNVNIFPKKENKKKIENTIVDYSEYINKVLENSTFHDEFYKFYCKKLYELRGITLNTAITCLIGYNPDKGWIFPVYRYPDMQAVGYEVRKKDFTLFDDGNKCYKSREIPSCLSVVYQGWNNKRAYICEGFVDSYFLYQFKYEQNYKFYKGHNFQINEWIMTPTNGVHTIPNLMKELKLWQDFDEIIFCLDNDKAGNDTKAILAELPHEGKFKFFNQLKEGDDIEKWYKRIRKLN
jgi:DNA primase